MHWNNHLAETFAVYSTYTHTHISLALRSVYCICSTSVDLALVLRLDANQTNVFIYSYFINSAKPSNLKFNFSDHLVFLCIRFVVIVFVICDRHYRCSVSREMSEFLAVKRIWIIACEVSFHTLKRFPYYFFVSFFCCCSISAERVTFSFYSICYGFHHTSDNRPHRHTDS